MVDFFNLKIVILVLLVLVLGFLTSWSDIKHKRISNVVLLVFFILGLFFNLFQSRSEFVVNYFFNLLFAFFVGFLLWYVNFWNAGDGKLFSVFVSLVPVSLVFRDKSFLFSYNIIFNTFVPIFVVFFFMMVFSIRRDEFFSAVKHAFKVRVMFNIVVAFFSFQWIIILVNASFGLRLNLFVSAVILFLIFDVIEKIINIKLVHLFYVISIVRLLFDDSLFSLNFLIVFILQVIIFIVFINFFLYLAYFKFGVHVRIPDLKQGMNLCENIIKRDGTYTVIPDVKISLFTFLNDKRNPRSAVENKPGGLTKEDINKIQEWNKSGKIEVGALLIQKRVPYAPFQFLGVIIFLISQVI